MSKHRLSQVNAPVVNAQVSTLKALADERLRCYTKLSLEDTLFYQDVKHTFKIDDLKQIHLIKLKFSKDRGATYSGCSPYSIVDSIVSDWTLNEPSISIYTFANNCFPMQYPCFMQNDLSSLRTARYNQDTKQLNYSRTMQNFSTYELLESFWGVLAGTLNAFNYNENKDKNRDLFSIQLLSLSMVSLHHSTCFGSGNDLLFMTSDQDKKETTNFPVASAEKKVLISQALNRDTHPEFAARIRQLSSVTKVRQFYRLYAESAKENPQLLHQSVWPRLEYFIFGLLLFPNDSPTSEIIRDCILSAIFNRSIRAVPPLPKIIENCMDENELIKLIFENSSKLINSVRYFAFMTQFCLLFNASGKQKCVSSGFAEQIQFMHQNILNCPSIQVLCQLIHLKGGKEYTLENVADLFATIHASDQKDKRFSTVTINSNKAQLKRIIDENTQNILKRKEELAQFKQAAGESDKKDRTDQKERKSWDHLDSADTNHIFANFLDSYGEFELKSKLEFDALQALPTLSTSSNYKQLCQFIVKHAVSGGISNAKMLIGVYFAYVNNPQHSFILTLRRFLKWVVWSSYNPSIDEEEQKSVVYKCFKVIRANNHSLESDSRKVFSDRKLRWDNAEIKKYGLASFVSVPESKSSSSSSEKKEVISDEALYGIPIQLKTFEPSCLTLLKILVNRGECVICFEANQKLVKLHKIESSESVQHVVCSSCSLKLRQSANPSCPFCRADISR